MGKKKNPVDVAIARVPVLRELARKVAKKEAEGWAKRGWTKPEQEQTAEKGEKSITQVQKDLFPRITPEDIREAELRDRGLPPDAR